MRHQPADKMFAKMARRREKRFSHCHNIKGAARTIDQYSTPCFNPMVRTVHFGEGRSGRDAWIDSETTEAYAAQPV